MTFKNLSVLFLPTILLKANNGEFFNICDNNFIDINFILSQFSSFAFVSFWLNFPKRISIFFSTNSRMYIPPWFIYFPISIYILLNIDIVCIFTTILFKDFINIGNISLKKFIICFFSNNELYIPSIDCDNNSRFIDSLSKNWDISFKIWFVLFRFFRIYIDNESLVLNLVSFSFIDSLIIELKIEFNSSAGFKLLKL